ncbi:MAG: DUF1697 domain-containing protein [Coriobacteriia bacterium]|nr:DUF1697 domain-containing protein [Coriobacteriia bacterium]
MTRFVALLRGVNVGGSRKVEMAALRAALERVGFVDVRTYLQSGNVVFAADSGTAPQHALAVAQCIEREFGFPVDTLVLACDELARIAASNPFLAADSSVDERWLHAAFLLEPLTAEEFDARALPADEGERALLGDGAVYLLLPHGVGRSKLATGIGRVLNTPMTSRNWRTVTALAAMCGERARA